MDEVTEGKLIVLVGLEAESEPECRTLVLKQGKLWTNHDELVSLIKTIQRDQIKVLELRFEPRSL